MKAAFPSPYPPAGSARRRPTAARPRHRATVLPDGLAVVTAELPHMASVAFGLWINTGSRHEPEPRAGIAHFIEHMLFKGTRHRSPAEISQAVEGLGGYLNAFTDEEHTCYYSRARADHWPTLLDVLMDMYLHATFTPADIRKEREVIKEELAMYRDQPAEHVQDLLNAIQFPGHPLGRPVLGSESALDRLRRPHFLRHMDTCYVAGRTVLAAAGQIRHETLVEAVRPYSRDLHRNGLPPEVTAPPEPTSPTFRGERRDIGQANFALGIRTCPRHDPRRFALRLLNTLLGENMSSRLFQVVREQHGLTYNIQTSLTSWQDAGDLTISAGLAPAELRKTLRLVQTELQRLRQRVPSRRELNRARDFVIGQFELSLEGTEHHMMWLGEQWSHQGRLTAPEIIKDRIAAVTPQAIRSVASDFFRPERLSLALVGPDASERQLPRNWAG